jgi:hypothetical protein
MLEASSLETADHRIWLHSHSAFFLEAAITGYDLPFQNAHDFGKAGL